MGNFGIRYLVVLALVAGFFTNAVACGTGLYQVSMREDFDEERVSDPATVTPSAPTYGIHAVNGWAKIPIMIRFGTSMNPDQKKELSDAMKQWEWAVGRKLFDIQGVHGGVDGDNFQDLYSSLKDNINGEYMDTNWSKTAKPSQVLATTIWDNGVDSSVITTADIRFNSQYYIIGDSLALSATGNKEVVDMQSLALHELGHFLGLAHIDPQIDKYSIMNPSLFIGEGLTSRELSRDDIARIQKIYGCAGTACDIDALMKQQNTALAEQQATKTQVKTGGAAH